MALVNEPTSTKNNRHRKAKLPVPIIFFIHPERPGDDVCHHQGVRDDSIQENLS
ncbi:hypothetical protein IC229_15600 [Spirosoma sp. BT702]|uniref:Uncharacterized protein n=1 Tax=Spirosoma profusum TaxID=2771354 RepID=A0A927ASZ5_9BACT|nr:hypothetical protein [Spirosoma profusum]MBD2702075.1 hypothetical protein [Spirosoma profusum]